MIGLRSHVIQVEQHLYKKIPGCIHIFITSMSSLQMSFHAGHGCPRGRPAAPGPMYQPAPPRYHYDPPAAPGPIYNPQGGSGYMPPHPDFMPFHFPAPSHGSNALSQCPIRPPVFPEPPPFPPLAPHNSDSSVPVQSSYPYMMPTITPPPLPPVPHSVPPSMPYPPSYPMSYPPQPQLPPPPSFNPAYVQPGGSFKPERSRPPLQYKADSCSRSPERLRHHDDHRHSGHSYGGYGGRHNREFGGEKRDRGCSSERRRSDSPRYKVDYERGRVPSRHRSRERYRHREEPGSSPSDRHRKHIRNRSGSRERKRRRVEEEKGRRTDSASSSRERSVNYSRSRDAEETSTDRHEEEKGEEELLKPAWIRCTHAENYYSNDPMDQVGDSTVVGTSKLRDLYERFEEELGRRQVRAKSSRPKWEPPKTKLDQDQDESSSESECDSNGGGSSCSSSSDSEVFDVIAEIKRKKAHPDRLHEELWYNDAGQMNDGPLCKCSAKARRTGIRHSIYPGEQPVKACRPMSNNAGKLFHYRITVSPPTNFLTDRPTVIEYDDHEYLFEGFSCFSHTPLTNIPLCRVIRFNIDYTIHFIEEMAPENYCIKGLELFSSYLFKDILELYDWNLTGPEDNGQSGCQRFHFMPRFVRFLPDGGKEVLSMHQVLLYLLRSSTALVPEEEIANMLQWEELEWQKYAEECKGMIVTNPGMKPSSVRIDQLDREQFNSSVITFPIIVHFGIRPAQLSYAGDPQYQKLWKSYVKLRHLLANSPKVKQIEKQKLTQREEALQKIRQKNTMRREVTVELSSQGFWKSGIRSDVCQHAMMLPVLTHHIRYHQCLMHLDKLIGYMFKERCLLQLAMTHPSHHLNFGMNPDHARNSLSNCGIRQPKYGDRKVHHMYMRKKGINTLINIMSRLGQDDPSPSRINHNERLEFLGDAVVEFLTSVHLYYLFPNLEEGGLATYRTAIVQNQHLAMLAKKLELDRFMLYAHGPDLCRESDLRHAMANCFEALIGAVYLEGGLEEAKQLFGRLLFNSEELRDVWLNYPPHPLQVQEPLTDRQLIESSPVLQKLTNFEDAIGVLFTHARLLARAFTLRTVGFNHLTLGHNQRMEFLGDSIMQLVATEYLFIHFPDHHEGHLTVSISLICSSFHFLFFNSLTSLMMHSFVLFSFISTVMLFILFYRTLQTVGPSHARTYTVAVYFKGERIGYNFPQMAHQKRFIERKYRQELKEMRRERERQERDSDEG
uniref:Ribonuclease 3-like n=1 Tax=Sinocyclocheilus anshuiensis TaxID=1608454 RepID=A0A671QEL0_9TELE